jgi:hypothetical protein
MPWRRREEWRHSSMDYYPQLRMEWSASCPSGLIPGGRAPDRKLVAPPEPAWMLWSRQSDRPPVASSLHRLSYPGSNIQGVKNKKFWEKLIAYFPWYDTSHIKNDASNNSSIVSCVFVTALRFLASCYLATTRGYTDMHARTHAHTHSNVISLAYSTFSLLSLFWKNKSRLMRSRYTLCMCLCIPLIVAR